jgi:2-dehydropantoate 2-reductase
MKIAVIGSGGIGGFYGGRLAHAGADVTFVARGKHLEAMRKQGLLIENAAQGNIHLPKVKVTDNPETIGHVDLVLIAVKLWDLESAAQAFKPIVAAHTAILSLQNGVIKDDILTRLFGNKSVMGGVAYVATQIKRPGVISQTGKLQRIVFGEYDGTQSKRAQALLDLALKAELQAELSTDIRRTLWEKYTFLVGLSGTTTTMRQTIGPIRDNPQTRTFLHDMMKEVVAVGRAHGVSLPDNFADQQLAFTDTFPAETTSSMHHDIEGGKPLEVEWLSGGVVTLGARVGVPTPVNRAVWDTLTLYSKGRRHD